MNQTLKDHSLYFLRDPRDNSVFYVGITNDPQRRYQDHISSISGNYEKDTQIYQLAKLGLLPIRGSATEAVTRGRVAGISGI